MSTPFILLAITGQLVSGKNQVQLLFRRGKVHKYPNKTFTNWRAKAYVQILEQVSRYGTRRPTIKQALRVELRTKLKL